MAIAVALLAPAAGAQPSKQRDAARALADAGYELYTQEDWAGAYDRFENAEDIFHAPPHVLYMARAKAKLGELLAARDLYARLADEKLGADAPPAFHDAKRDAQKELDALARTIPTLTVDVEAPAEASVRLTIDGRPAAPGSAVLLDPGKHTVAAEIEGAPREQREVTLEAGAAERVAIVFASSAAADGDDDGGASSEPPGAIGPAALMSIGGVGLVIGGVTGGLALGKAGELKDACPARTGCPAENRDLEDSARTLGITSTVAFVVGGVAVGAGLTWLVVELAGGSSTDETAVVPTADGFAVRF
jgi:hypothetical protein